MESSGDLPNRFDRMFGNLTEMVEGIEARSNQGYSNFIISIFSMGNVQASYQIMLAALSVDDSLPSLKEMNEIWSDQMAVMISSYAAAVMAQDPDYHKLPQPEQRAKRMAYIMRIRTDVMMLLNEQARTK